jgi:hypothetical protein
MVKKGRMIDSNKQSIYEGNSLLACCHVDWYIHTKALEEFWLNS